MLSVSIFFTWMYYNSRGCADAMVKQVLWMYATWFTPEQKEANGCSQIYYLKNFKLLYWGHCSYKLKSKTHCEFFFLLS